MAIVEERCYVLQTPFSPAQYLEIYEAEGLQVQLECLKGLVGYFVSEVGELNALISLWQYPSFEERIQRRTELAARPEWQAYLRKIKPLIRSMSNRLLLPTSFSPIS